MQANQHEPQQVLTHPEMAGALPTLAATDVGYHARQYPATRLAFSANEEGAWRYKVLRNGRTLRHVRSANCKTGEVTIWKMILPDRRGSVTSDPNAEPVDPFELSQRPGVMLVSAGEELPEAKRYWTLPTEENGQPVVVQIRRVTPPVGQAEWDSAPTETAEATAEAPVAPPVVVAAAPEPLPARVEKTLKGLEQPAESLISSPTPVRKKDRQKELPTGGLSLLFHDGDP